MRASRLSASRTLVLAIVAMVLPLLCGMLLILAGVQGWASFDHVNFFLGIAAFVVTIYVALFTGFISWRALVFAALPRIQITYLGESSSRRTVFYTKENSTIRFALTNIGWWYAKPASTNTKLYVNFDPSFEPRAVHYGSNLEKTDEEILRGKRDSKYFIVRGIHLYYGESGEDVEVEVKMPPHPGKYPVWITARSDECDHGTFKFEIDVKARVATRRSRSVT